MKKQALKAVTMLVSIIALAFMTAVVSNAQSGGRQIRADIPFDFVVGDKTLAAGEYSIGQVALSSDEVTLVRSRDGRKSAATLTSSVKAGTPKKRGMLTFHRFGSTYYLSQIWVSGSSEGRQMVKSKAERNAERELARNPSGSELANNARPEMVTIFAELQ